jgi:hypothetical protein
MVIAVNSQEATPSCRNLAGKVFGKLTVIEYSGEVKMTKEMTNIGTKNQQEQIIYSLIVNGDVSKLTPEQKVQYYTKFCENLGLNPITKPFEYIKLNGKEVLYAKKDATEQLRKQYGVSVISMESKQVSDVWITQVSVKDKLERTDMATGAVSVKNLSGEALANAVMKCETKAKRRATLSICGLGMLDELEIETIPNSAKELPENKKPEPKTDPKPESKHTPDVLKNDKGDQAAALKKIYELKKEEHIIKFLNLRAQRTWTDEELKEQDAAIAALNIKLNFQGEDVK